MASLVQQMRRMRNRQSFWAWVFMAPGILYFMVFLIIPLVAATYVSFTNWDILTPPKWVGLKNYAELLQNQTMRRAILNTFYYAAVTIPVTISLGLLIALALNRSFFGRTVYRIVYYLPVVISAAATALLWIWIFQSQVGLLNHVLRSLSLPTQSWLVSPLYAMPVIMWTGIWQSLGWSVVVFLAGLQNIPEMYYEAGKIDGANTRQLFRHITWPLLAPTTLFVFVILIIGSMQVFGTVLIMTDGGPLNSTTVIVHQVYINAFQYLRMGYASAMGMILFLFILVLALTNLRIFGRSTEN
ncbi:ABC transporter permease subunit [bacterium]|nr:ABC transporter permease subunit [bacterium]